MRKRSPTSSPSGGKVGDSASFAPSLIVATPHVRDPSFARSVILLAEHGPEGSLGFVLNRVADVHFSDVASVLGFAGKTDLHLPVRTGGPVSPEAGWLVFDPRACSKTALADSVLLSNGVALSASQSLLEDIARGRVQVPRGRGMLILGYAGWSPQQLDEEFLRGDWTMVQVDEELIFEEEPDRLWNSTLLRGGIDPARFVPAHSIFST